MSGAKRAASVIHIHLLRHTIREHKTPEYHILGASLLWTFVSFYSFLSEMTIRFRRMTLEFGKGINVPVEYDPIPNR